MLSSRLLLSALAAVQFATLARAENWPAWRGLKGDGTTSETNLPLTWSATENVKWKVALPGPSNSTPIAWGDRVFITQAEGESRMVMAFDRKDGALLWKAGPTVTEKE